MSSFTITIYNCLFLMFMGFMMNMNIQAQIISGCNNKDKEIRAWELQYPILLHTRCKKQIILIPTTTNHQLRGHHLYFSPESQANYSSHCVRHNYSSLFLVGSNIPPYFPQ